MGPGSTGFRSLVTSRDQVTRFPVFVWMTDGQLIQAWLDLEGAETDLDKPLVRAE